MDTARTQTRARPRGRTVLILLLACLGVVALKAATMQSGGPSEIRRLALGEGGKTSQGNEVTVYGWKAQGGAEPGRSAIDFRSCRSSKDQPLVSAGAFSLEAPDGKTLTPQGSDLKIEGDCVSGEVFFADTRGIQPRSASYSRGDVELSWPLGGG